MTTRRPAEVFHPGEYLLDELNARDWTQVEFAKIIGRDKVLVNQIVKGKRGITPETAKLIGAALGTSAEVWLNLDSAYNLWKAQEEDDLDQVKLRGEMASRFPVRDMILRNWLVETEDPGVMKNQLLRFFEIPSLDSTPGLVRFSAARRSNYENEEMNPVQIAWLYRVKHIADSMVVPNYNPAKLKKALLRLEELRAFPEQIRYVPEILESCGVRFVIVEPFSASKIDGVCFWINGSPVIGITLRYDRLDNFWFVLIHEIDHVLNEDGKEYAVVDIDMMESENEILSDKERRANLTAAEFCTPQSELEDLIRRKGDYISTKEFVGFAMSLNIDPGIVAGQLRKRSGRWDRFNNLNKSVREHIVPVSLTDGYGQSLPIEI